MKLVWIERGKVRKGDKKKRDIYVKIGIQSEKDREIQRVSE